MSKYTSEWTQIDGATTSPVIVVELDSGVSYDIKVISVDDNGSVDSEVITFSTNSVPLLSITEKYQTNPYYVATMPIVLSATAIDGTDGDISNQIIWTSNLDGILGTGTDLQITNLSMGSHVISASATNSAGESSVDFFTIRVVALYGNFSFDDYLDRWLTIRNESFSASYRSYLRGLSSSGRLSELRKRGCWALP